MKEKLFRIKKIGNIALLLMLLLSSASGFSSCSHDSEVASELTGGWVALNQSEASLSAGEELSLVPSFSDATVEKMNYIWSSSNSEIATVKANNDNSATITALAEGETIIELVCTDNNLLLASCKLTVTAKSDGKIRILAIGNSFSQDAVEQYLYELADAEGITLVIGNMYIGGCSLQTHLNNARNNSPAYEYRKIENGIKTNRSNVTLSEGIADENWDYISLQQVSGNSGQYETFEASLPALVEYVKERASNSKMKLMLHQTWAYAGNSTHTSFPNYDNDQMKMYTAIVDAVNKAAALVNIDIVIPSGTAIQNGRTSYIGDNFNRDGYHLELTYGRYTAACTWFEKILGQSVIGNPYAPEGVHPSKIEIAQQAAHAAVINPNEITVLEDYKNPPVDTEVLKAPVYIDFGSSMSGSPWNNFTSNLSTDEFSPLIDADGDYTKFGLRVSKSFSSVFPGVGTEPINIGFEIPASVFKDGLLVSDENPGEIQIDNLDPQHSYSLEVFGLRWNSSVTRNTTYKITGADVQSYSLAVGTKDPSTLESKFFTVGNILPDVNGKITIEVERGADNAYQSIINALRISVAE